MELHGRKRSSTELGEAERQEDPSYSHDILRQKAQKKVEAAHGVAVSGLSPQAIRRLEKTTDRLKEKIGNAELSGSGDKRNASEDEATRTMAMSALEEIQLLCWLTIACYKSKKAYRCFPDEKAG